ncbi:MAG: peptidylprolyl isomerase [Rhodocyclaceae bacterium]|nr:peptidylprolyl isomerase [Rhodocyclaceae bacterium]
MKRSTSYALLLTCAGILAMQPVLAQKADVVATVNGKAIPKNRADALIAGQAAQGQPDSAELRKAVKEELVRREILTQESQKKGFDKKPEVQGQIDLARQGVLIGAYLNDYVRAHPVSEEMVKKEYENVRAQIGDKEYKVRHILVETEAEAKSIIDRLKKGEKFDELAKLSKDPGSKDKGGDLGWANKGAYVKPFTDAMVKLKKGELTDPPIKSDFGWHVIQLEDVRELKLPGFDEAKPQITQRLQQQMVQKHIEELRSKAKVD